MFEGEVMVYIYLFISSLMADGGVSFLIYLSILGIRTSTGKVSLVSPHVQYSTFVMLHLQVLHKRRIVR